MYVHCRLLGTNTYLPIVNYDSLRTRRRNLQRLTPQNSTMNVTVEYSPISLGKLRMLLQVQASIENVKVLGFSDKDVDDVKGIFTETNIYLLSGTLFIASVHVSVLNQILRNCRKKINTDLVFCSCCSIFLPSKTM